MSIFYIKIDVLEDNGRKNPFTIETKETKYLVRSLSVQAYMKKALNYYEKTQKKLEQIKRLQVLGWEELL